MTDPRTNEPQHDRELEDYLAGRHALSVRYLDASRETVPPELDAAVLASARAAVAPAPRRRARWRVPLAAAATMVLGVSLVSQLHDDAVPDAVRSDGDLPLARQAPAQTATREAEIAQPLSMESVADAVAPSVPLPAAPPADPAKKAAAAARAPEEADMLAETRRRQERLAGAATEDREVARPRERSAPAESRAAAPQAFALSPPAPAPTLDDVSTAAREMLTLLQAQDLDTLADRSSDALTRAALELTAPIFADAHAAQVLPRRQGESAWRLVFIDAAGRRLGDAELGLDAQGWQLRALEAAP